MEVKLRFYSWNVGLLAGIFMLSFYLLTLTVFNDFNHAISQFKQYWFFISLLVVGFSIQAGLFFFMHERMKATKGVAVSGAMSAGSMIACCAHHITDIIPFLGLSAVGAFLASYQPVFLVLGVLSNAVGISLMFRHLDRAGLLKSYKRLSGISFDVLFKGVVAGSSLVFVVYVLYFTGIISFPGITGLAFSDSSSFSKTLLDSQNGIEFDVTPSIDEGNLDFTIGINNHQVNLDFDILEASTLTLNDGSVLKPRDWRGTPLGGHHASGTLSFGKVPKKLAGFSLEIDAMGALRVFEW